MRARVLEDNTVKLYTNDFFDLYPDLVSSWIIVEITEEQYNFISTYKMPKYVNGVFFDSYVEVIEVPKQLSRMKFKMQVLITTGITYNDIIAFIQGLSMSEFYKKLLLIRLEDCIYFERYSEDLNTIANLMGITQEQLDEIFINGNLIE